MTAKYSPSLGLPRTSGERSDIHTPASSDSPSSSLKKALNASRTIMRPKSHVWGTAPSNPAPPVTPGSRSVASSATTATANASRPGPAPPCRPCSRSAAMTSRTPTARTSSGPNRRRLSTVSMSPQRAATRAAGPAAFTWLAISVSRGLCRSRMAFG